MVDGYKHVEEIYCILLYFLYMSVSVALYVGVQSAR
jgi:hypothetical protein